jgi:hypothetical protein
VHEIDGNRMVELRRVCSTFDSPTVRLSQIPGSLVFKADAWYAGTAYFELSTDLTFLVARGFEHLSSEKAPTPRGDDLGADPTAQFGNLPGMFPVSAAVESRNGHFVFYSIPDEKPDCICFTTIVRYDKRQGRVTGSLVLSDPGCQNGPDDPDRLVHYLLVTDDGHLIALAGATSELIPGKQSE